MEYTHHYDSPIGGITVASNGTQITGLWFDNQKYFAYSLDENNKPADLGIFDLSDKWLDIYFSGNAPDFDLPILIKGTPFRKMICSIMREIPFGKTVTYGEIAQIAAQKTGKKAMSSRAVGVAVGHNPISIIIPCHRVIGANGKLTGYAGGLDKKIELLKLEKAI